MDPKRLELGQQWVVPGKVKRTKVPRHKAGEKFLKGPVPLNWLISAAQLPGKSLHVGIVLWFLAGLCGKPTVALPNGVLRLFGVDRHAKYRALSNLEQAGLIESERHSGRSPAVTLLGVGETDEEA